MSNEPTDKEINALVLTSLFGWRWMSRTSKPSGDRKTALIAPDGDTLGYAPSNWYAPDWTPSYPTAPRFTDWDKSNIKRDQQGDIVAFTLPDFCNDRNLLPLLWVKLEEEEHGVFYLRLSHMGLRGEWARHTATPRQQTEAVLRTLEHWPTEWRAASSASPA